MFRNKLNDGDTKSQVNIQKEKVLLKCLDVYNKIFNMIKSSFKVLVGKCKRFKNCSADICSKAKDRLLPIAVEVKITLIKVLKKSYQMLRSVYFNYKNEIKASVKPVSDYISLKVKNVSSKVNVSFLSLRAGLASGDRSSWIKVSQGLVPVIAVGILIYTVNYWNNINYGLVLACEGKEIAIIQDESVFEEANQMVSKRLVYNDNSKDDNKEKGFTVSPSYKLAVVSDSTYSSCLDVCDKIIEQSKGTIEEATGVYVDNNLIGAVKEEDKVEDLLQSVLDEAASEDDVQVAFAENVESVNGLYFSESVVKFDELKQLVTEPVETEETYTVEDGDSPLKIADKFNMSVEELENLNGQDLQDKMYPGEKVIVKGAKHLLTVKVTKEQTYEKDIGYNTVETKDDSEYTDYSKIVVEGENGLEKCTDLVTYIDGSEVARENIKSEIIKQAVDKQVIVGTKERPKSNFYDCSGTGKSSGSLMWPVPTVRGISSGYGYRGGYMHSGIDISSAGAYGQTIVAADGGVVTSVNYQGYGYGYHLEVSHGNGISTLYAHCSSIYVRPGQTLSKGQPIAAIGSTGDSTGPHLHFEVRVGGNRVNPLNYV